MPAPNYRYVALAVLTLAQGGVALITSGLGTLAPFFATALALNRAQVGLVAGAIGISWIFMSSSAGVLVDRFGERRVIVLSGMAMGVVLFVAAALQSYPWLLGWLAVFGIVASFSTPAGGRAIMLWFTRDRGLAMGIRQGGVPIGGFLAAVVLAPIAARAGYRAALVAAGAGIVVATAAVLFLKAPPERTIRAKPRFRQLWREMRAFARDRRSIIISLAQVDHNAAQSCALAFLSISLIATTHMSVPAAVLALALMQLGSIAGRFFWGFVSDRVLGGERFLPIAAACVIGTLAELVLTLHYQAAGTAVTALMYVAAFGLGFSIAGCNGLFAVAQTEAAGPDLAGSALGIASGRMALSMAFAPPLFGIVADASGYSTAWLILAAITLLGIVPAFAARRVVARSRELGWTADVSLPTLR